MTRKFKTRYIVLIFISKAVNILICILGNESMEGAYFSLFSRPCCCTWWWTPWPGCLTCLCWNLSSLTQVLPSAKTTLSYTNKSNDEMLQRNFTRGLTSIQTLFSAGWSRWCGELSTLCCLVSLTWVAGCWGCFSGVAVLFTLEQTMIIAVTSISGMWAVSRL